MRAASYSPSGVQSLSPLSDPESRGPRQRPRGGAGQVPRGLCCLEQDSPLGVSLCRDSSLEGPAGPLCRSTSRGTETRQGHALCPLGQRPRLSSFDGTARLVL